MTAEESLYRERAHLVALMASLYPAYIGADLQQPDWPVVYIETPVGQCSWHIATADVDLFEHVRPADTSREGRDGWDGHSTAEKYRRIRNLTRLMALEPAVWGPAIDQERQEHSRPEGRNLQPSITCPACGWTSWNSGDVRERYCGNCHQFHDDMQLRPPDQPTGLVRRLIRRYVRRYCYVCGPQWAWRTWRRGCTHDRR